MTRTRSALSALSRFTLPTLTLLTGCAVGGAAPASSPADSKAMPAETAARGVNVDGAPGAPASEPDAVTDAVAEGRSVDFEAKREAPPPAAPPPPPPAPADMPAASAAPRVAGAMPSTPRGGGAGAPIPASVPARPSGYAPRPAATIAAEGHSDRRGPPAKVAEEERVIVAEMAAPSASVKAGEWDDNANYREFQRWVRTEQGQPFHRVDVSDRQFLVVRDADGKAVPRCPVVISDAQGRRVTLTTTASGRALLFPHAEGLQGRDLTASASCQNGAASARVSLDQNDAVVDLKLAVKRALPATREVDLAFILDTTGSMSEEIAAVKATIQKVASAFGNGPVRVRVGMVEFKDRTDDFTTHVYPMTTDLSRFSSQVSAIQASGGGDTPEDVNEGLHVGLTRLQWSDGAVARMAFLIGDAPPHLDYAGGADYAVDMREAAHRGIQIFTVAASGMDSLGQVVWRQVAQYTGATNLFVLRGGAGPQSTGAGDPKSSCGGTQTAFASGNLDALIVQKVNREIRGLDRDPLRIAGLRVDENAKPCSERLMVAE